MNKIILFLVLVSLNLSLIAQTNTMCKDITQKGVDVVNAKDYIPDGRYNSVKLAQGERIEVYKPFYMSKNYFIVVSCEDMLPGITVELKDINKNTIYKVDQTSKEHEFAFSPDKNQNIIISIQVQNSSDYAVTNKGCVSLVVGFKN